MVRPALIPEKEFADTDQLTEEDIKLTSGAIMFQSVPKHIVRLLLLLAAALLLAWVVRTWLTDPSYYRYGYYRADAVPELAEGDLRYLGSPYCQAECHEQRYADWPVGAHKTVQCEVCHGPAPAHPDDKISLIPPDSIRLCSTCHEAMPARPVAQPQIVLDQHPFDDGEIMPCLDCHDPHSPGPVVRDEASADAATTEADAAGMAVAMPATASKCGKCHGKQGEGVKDNPVLAGLDPAVFIERINTYRSGGGDSKVMTRFAKSLSDEETAELAAWYAGLPAKKPQ
jgi:cytochrome c553